MAKKNIKLTEVAFDGAYVRNRENEDGTKYVLVSESAFSTITWNVEASEGAIELIEDENSEGHYTLKSGNEKINLVVEKQNHELGQNKTWKITGEKLSDGTTIKLNGTASGTFEVWTNQNINSKGKRTWKRVSISKTEAQGKKNLNQAIKEYKATISEVSAKAE